MIYENYIFWLEHLQTIRSKSPVFHHANSWPLPCQVFPVFCFEEVRGAFLITQSGCKMDRMEDRWISIAKAPEKIAFEENGSFLLRSILGLNFQWRFWVSFRESKPSNLPNLAAPIPPELSPEMLPARRFWWPIMQIWLSLQMFPLDLLF